MWQIPRGKHRMLGCKRYLLFLASSLTACFLFSLYTLPNFQTTYERLKKWQEQVQLTQRYLDATLMRLVNGQPRRSEAQKPDSID